VITVSDRNQLMLTSRSSINILGYRGRPYLRVGSAHTILPSSQPTEMLTKSGGRGQRVWQLAAEKCMKT